jgi:hypothetical protein
MPLDAFWKSRGTLVVVGVNLVIVALGAALAYLAWRLAFT